MREPMLTPQAQEAIARIAHGYRPEQIILFGSHARGDAHLGSDLDLIIIKETTAAFLARLDAVLALCTGEIAVEPLVYTPAEVTAMLARGNDFLETALAEGCIVYEKQQSRRSRSLAGAGQTRSRCGALGR